MSANDWKREMACMLGNVENQVTLTLTNISRSSRSFDEEFKEYFFRTLIDRVATTYGKFEMELRLERGHGGNHTTRSQQNDSQKAEVENKDHLVNVLTSNVPVISISDSSDDEDMPSTGLNESYGGISRLSQTNNHVEIDSHLDEEVFGHTSSSTTRITRGAEATNSIHIISELEDQTQSMMDIDDSSDEEGARAHASRESVGGVTAQMASPFDSSNANARDKGDGLEQSKESDTSTEIANDYTEFRIGSTIIRRRQSNAGNGTGANVADEDVSLDTIANEINTERSIECEATNIVRMSNLMDFDAQDGMIIDRRNTNGGSDASNEVQRNYNTRSAVIGIRMSKKTTGATTASNSQNVSGQKKTNRFKCQLCEYVDRHKWNFNQHMQKHSGEEPYPCDRCGRGFARADHLKRHAATHFPFHCEGCYRGFSRKVQKQAHYKKCKARRYECYCCKKFIIRDKNILKIHMRKHTGEKPFRCEICMMHFTQKNSLKRHLNTIHTRINL